MIVSTNIQGGIMKILLNKLISNWPFKVLLVVAIGIAIVATGITNIELSTGNETLIEESSDTYEDNLQYQTNFGTDPIIIVFEHENQTSLLSYESLSTLNDLNDSIKDLEGVFYINGPISVIDYVGEMSVANYQVALDGIASGLQLISSSISDMSDSQPDIDTEALATALNNIIEAQNNISTGLDNEVVLMQTMKTNVLNEIQLLNTTRSALDPVADEVEYLSLTRTITVLTGVDNLYSQMITLSQTFSDGTSQTAVGVQGILTQLNTMFTSITLIQTNLGALETNISTMAANIEMLADNFNGFTATFPSEGGTLENMIYPDGINLNPMLSTFQIDETHMFVSIILEEGTTEANIGIILDEIDEVLAETIYEDSLVSGKPVLNYDIKSSMMDSMKIMMITAGIIMVVILLILFPVPFRLLPLVVVLIAVIGTIGVMGLTSIPLTMVSMAVFPVLIGLGIDYSIQFHNRYTEELEIVGDSNE
jgi:predicted RND superfamily exporter protein